MASQKKSICCVAAHFCLANPVTFYEFIVVDEFAKTDLPRHYEE